MANRDVVGLARQTVSEMRWSEECKIYICSCPIRLPISSPCLSHAFWCQLSTSILTWASWGEVQGLLSMAATMIATALERRFHFDLRRPETVRYGLCGYPETAVLDPSSLLRRECRHKATVSHQDVHDTAEIFAVPSWAILRYEPPLALHCHSPLLTTNISCPLLSSHDSCPLLPTLFSA